MESSSADDAWKIFNRDTEAGRLLSRLYGVSPAGKVSYPKQRRRRRRVTDSQANSEETRQTWRTTGGVVRSWNKTVEEEKEKERTTNIARALSLNVPKVGRSSSVACNFTSLKIDTVPRRKTELDSRGAIQEAKHKQKLYRPPHAHNFSSETEKKRLQRMMTDGKQGLQKLAISPPKPKSRSGEDARPSTLFDQIYQEILERRKFQLQMETSGAGATTRDSTVYEIKERLEQLKKIDFQRAKMIVQNGLGERSFLFNETSAYDNVHWKS